MYERKIPILKRNPKEVDKVNDRPTIPVCNQCNPKIIDD
jgi:hypothetical protein